MSKINIIISSIFVVSALFMSVCITKINNSYALADQSNAQLIAEKEAQYQETIKDNLTQESITNNNQNNGSTETATFLSVLNKATDNHKDAKYMRMDITNGDIQINFTVKNSPIGDINGEVYSNLMVEQIRNQGRSYLSMSYYGDIYDIVKPFFKNEFYCKQYTDDPLYYVYSTTDSSQINNTHGKYDVMTKSTYESMYMFDLNALCNYITEETIKSEDFYTLSNSYSAMVTLNTEKEQAEDPSKKSATSAYSTQISRLIGTELASSFEEANITFNFTKDCMFDTITYDMKLVLHYNLFGLDTPMNVQLRFTSKCNYGTKETNRYKINVEL